MSTSLNAQLEQYFRARPNVWIDGRTLETIAGRYAWRTRVSNLRTERGMTIENRQRKVTPTTAHGAPLPLLKPYTVSEYRYVPRPEAHAE